MTRSSILLAGAALLATASIAFAWQLAVKSDPDSIVANRVQGAWKLEVAVSDRLDAKRPANAVKELSFAQNDGVVPGLQGYLDKFKGKDIFSGGIVTVDGAAHTYILVGEHGGTSLVWFTGDTAGTNPTAQVTSMNLAIAVGRDRSNDILFLGGDARGNPALAYGRAAAAGAR